jgi:hypothetical protein
MSKSTITSADYNNTNGAATTGSHTGAASGIIDDANINDNSGAKQLRIAVGTTNPCKIDAVKKAVEKAVGFSADTTLTSNKIELHVEGFSVESDVPDQPFGDVR